MKKNFFNLQIIAWLLVLSSLFCFNINPVWADEQPEYNRAYSIDELFIQDLGPNDCPNRPEGQHYWDGRITVIPSLTNEGEYTYTCKSCGKTIKLRMQPAVSEYQIAAWRRSNPKAANADDVNTSEQNQNEQTITPNLDEVLHKGSGCQVVSKLSQGQIRQLLAAAPKFDFSAEDLVNQNNAWQAALTRLNALRQIVSLPTVTLDKNSAEQFTDWPDAMIADFQSENIATVMHRRWLLNPALGQETTNNAAYNYDYIAWPSSGNFPSDIFSADTPWSIILNPDKFKTPDIYAIHINVTRAIDGEKWHFAGDNYKAADSGKYFNVDVIETAKDSMNNCIIFRPNDISEYLGSYNISISGLQYLDGRKVTLTYDVEFFNLGEFDTAIPPTNQPNPEPIQPEYTETPFLDVQSSDYFAQPVAWAVTKGITKGASDTSFEPDNTCNKAQIITLLWRAYDSPQSSIPNPFRDLQKSDYYYDAALWAVENGIVAGNRFAGDTPCTRAMTVNYMWLAAGSPTPETVSNFTDVPVNTAYNLAVAWAVEQNITTGTTPTTFEPQQTCTRGQIVTLLYRNLSNKNR